MRVLSVNVGRPQQYEWLGQSVTTSIFKFPVEGEVQVSRLNLAGDAQSDLTVHGGTHKALYLYPHEHYAYWEAKGSGPLTLGNFGENLTTEGLLESDIHIGDELEIGSARFAVTQPRLPCYKLGLRFKHPEMTKLFYQSRRFGSYLMWCAKEACMPAPRSSLLNAMKTQSAWRISSPFMPAIYAIRSSCSGPAAWALYHRVGGRSYSIAQHALTPPQLRIPVHCSLTFVIFSKSCRLSSRRVSGYGLQPCRRVTTIRAFNPAISPTGRKPLSMCLIRHA